MVLDSFRYIAGSKVRRNFTGCSRGLHSITPGFELLTIEEKLEQDTPKWKILAAPELCAVK